MQYSPKLKKAMEEIKSILDKHDIAATVVIHTPGFSEWFFKINTSYSAASIENNQLRLKVNSKEHYNGDKKKKDEQLTNTANLFHHLSAKTMSVAMDMHRISKLVDEKLNAEHFGGGDTTHDQQNN